MKLSSPSGAQLSTASCMLNSANPRNFALLTSALRSAPLLNPSLSVSLDNKVIYHAPRNDQSSEKPRVSLISGGGSGHEPSFSSLVGKGLLTGAVAGTIFASPSANQVEWAVRKVAKNGSAGVCVIVMNYTGDILNFGLALSHTPPTITNTRMVVVADDVGVPRSASGSVGRRGIAGTVLVLKIAGALASNPNYIATLEQVTDLAELVAKNTISVGASLAHVHVPGSKTASDDIGQEDGVVEIGMGIHNEAGSEKASLSIQDLVGKMLSQLLDFSDKERAFLKVESHDEIVLLVNNLGGVSVLEFTALVTEVVDQLEKTWKIKPVRVLAGTFMTSLNGMGFSISLLKLADTGLGSGLGMLDLLEAPTEAVGWTAGRVQKDTWEAGSAVKSGDEKDDDDLLKEEVQSSNIQIEYAKAVTILATGLEEVIQSEPEITRYDTLVGDGDCGTGLKRGAEAILKVLKTFETTDLAVLLSHISSTVSNSMDGTSGALFGIFISSLLHSIVSLSPSSPKDPTADILAQGLSSALDQLSKYTPARPGSRTLMDALVPFVDTLSKTNDVTEAAEAATTGAEQTKGMKPSLGRTVYVGGDEWKKVPDPGAFGVAKLLEGFAAGMKKSNA